MDVIPRKKVFLCDPGDAGETLSLAQRRGLNIEIQGFAFPNSSGLSAEVEKYARMLAGFPGRITMHGAYFDLNPLSIDPKLAELSRDRYKQSLAIAGRLNAKSVIFHSTFSPLIKSSGYRESWIAQNIEFWPEFIDDARKAGQLLLLENLYEDRPEILLETIRRIGSDSMKVCLDVGHVNLYSQVPAVRWIEVLGSNLACLHLNDNNGETDEHLPPGEGTVDYPGLFAALARFADPPDLALEVESDEHFTQSLDYLARHGVDTGANA